MSTIKEIKNSLVAITQATQFDGAPAFVGVYDYPVTDLSSGHPIAVVLLEDGGGEFSDNRSNERTETFAINIVVDLEDIGMTSSVAFDRVYDLMDALKDALDDSQDLSGEVLYMNPSSGGIGLGQLGAGQAVIGTVTVDVRHFHEI